MDMTKVYFLKVLNHTKFRSKILPNSYTSISKARKDAMEQNRGDTTFVLEFNNIGKGEWKEIGYVSRDIFDKKWVWTEHTGILGTEKKFVLHKDGALGKELKSR